jgi:hypothetical protein
MPKILIDGVDYQTKCGESTVLPYSYSQAAQDIFALTMLGPKRNGTFLEIGAGDPVHGNNTYLLEHEFGFTGTSIELNESLESVWKDKRPNSALTVADAFEFDYSRLPRQIDYLQIDIDEGSLEILELVKDIRFSVITFEHDCYSGDLWPMWQSREILINQGYELLVNNVTIEPGRGVGGGILQFEDWYVDPLVIDRPMIHLYQWLDDTAYGYQQRPARQEPLKVAKYPRDILFKS